MSNHSNWSSSMRYDQFAVDSYVYLSKNFHQIRTQYRFPQKFFEDVIAVSRNNKNPMMLFIYIALFAVVLTMLRHAFTDFIVKPIAKKCRLSKLEQEKLPECSWNFLYYSSSWFLTAYILIVKEEGAPLLRPESMWHDWQFTKVLPFEYHVLYVLQLSYYLHSTYAIFTMDRWRKDSIITVFHHMIAFSLIFFGFSTRGHQAGTVVLFLHDICDVILEGTKLALYFKIQGKKKHRKFEVISNVGFILFSLVWFCSRLYVFPLRLIWSCTTLTAKMNVQVPLLFMINMMLYLLLIMNFYWFTFIVKVIYKVATGTDDLRDSRDYEDRTELDDDISSDSKETLKKLPIDSTDYSIKKYDAFKNLRRRSKVSLQSN